MIHGTAPEGARHELSGAGPSAALVEEVADLNLFLAGNPAGGSEADVQARERLGFAWGVGSGVSHESLRA